jgi:hypothetical protein
MSRSQKHAWFNLAVVALSLAVVLLLYPLLGKGALGGFGFLGLLGLGPLFYRKKKGDVVTDERDALIQQRAWIAAHSIFWLVFVAAGTLAPFFYGYYGAVPAMLINFAVYVGLIIFVVVHAIATLVQYAGGPNGEAK